MSFLKKNINMALVALILVLVLVATGTTVLYQRGLQQRTAQFETTSYNLSECLGQVENYIDSLEERESELNETSQDIAKYDTLYGQKVTELTKTEDDLTATKAGLTAMTLQKEQFKDKYSKSLVDLQSLENEKLTLLDEIAKRNKLISQLQSDLNSCEG
ncbi:hypothetical protein GOV07_00245 [Candidatus Woesearchaeota archaeon]|nr:hypothetical protein [Candidatus Woesearchaeota archaeon]